MGSHLTTEPVAYMQRTRAYYRALGYEKDYRWAHFEDVPFTPMSKRLCEARLALVTTAGPPDEPDEDQPAKRKLWSGKVSAPPETFNTELAWDRVSTHMKDRETFLPINAMTSLAVEGVFAELAPRFHGVPTEYSHRKTMEEDAPEILRRLRADKVDAVLLTAI